MSPLGQHRFRARGKLFVPSEPPPPDPDPVEPGTFSLAVNTSFNPNAPVLKNGTVLTGRALEAWQGLDNFLDANILTLGYTPTGDIGNRAARQSLYYYARELAEVYNLLFMILRLTGDVRVLDWLVAISDIQYGELQNRPVIGDLGDDVPMPIHDYRRWPWEFSQNDTYSGIDRHELDNPRTHAPLAQLLQALRMNENRVSPKGYDYEAKADKWENYLLNDWLKAWQGPEQKVGITLNSSHTGWLPASGWANVYKGSLHRYYTNSSTGKRAGYDGQPLWPVFSRNFTHTHVGCSALHYYLGKAIPSLAAATPVGLHGITELYLNRNVFYFDPSSSSSPYSGLHAVWPRALLFTGTYDAGNPGHNYPQPTNYASYVAMDLMNMWLDGALPDLPEQWGEPVAKACARWVWTDDPYNGDVGPDLLNTGTLSAATNARGETIPFRTAISQSGWGSISYLRAMTNVLTTLMAFDTPDDRIESELESHLERSSTLSVDRVGYAFPRVMGPNVGLLLKHVGARNWVLDGS